jgi:nicotinamide riboside transporter PnuC
MPLLLSALYILFAAGIGWLIWKQERRKDRNAEILGLDVGRQTAGVTTIVVFSVVLSIVPTVIAWGLLQSLL